MMAIGYNALTKSQISIDMIETGHFCIVGGTGSGKSVTTLYALYNLVKCYSVELYIADFKKSGDYIGFTSHYAEFDETVDLIQDYYKEFENTPEDNETLKILIVDEYAGFIIWLSQKDKKLCDRIKSYISNILMLGRSRLSYVWTVQQRISASLFPSGLGAIDNYQVAIGMGKLGVESRKSLFSGEHFLDEEFETSYTPRVGQGIILVDGRPLQPFEIPFIENKERLKNVIRAYAPRDIDIL